MTQARLGFGGEFQIGNGASPEVFTKLAEVIDIPTPNPTRNVVDATNLDSPNQFMEFIAGAKDPGEITVEMNLLVTNLTTVITDYNSGAQKNYRILIPTSPQKQLDFAAIPIGYSISGPHADKMTLSYNLKITGAVTLT